MSEPNRIDFSKLLGFMSVSDALEGDVDFKDGAMDARLGAKVGLEAWVECELRDGHSKSEPDQSHRA
jgi:hypothetical protein